MASAIISVLKLFRLIILPHSVKYVNQTSQCLKSIYLPISIIYPIAARRDLGFYLEPFFNIYKFPIKNGLLAVISIVHKNPNLGTGEAKNNLKCPYKDID